MTKNIPIPHPTRRTFVTATLAGLAAPMVMRRNAWAQGKEISSASGAARRASSSKRRSSPPSRRTSAARCWPRKASRSPTSRRCARPRTTRNSRDVHRRPGDPDRQGRGADRASCRATRCRRWRSSIRASSTRTATAPRSASRSAAMFHNTRVRPPTSYADLWDPRYRGKLKLVSPQQHAVDVLPDRRGRGRDRQALSPRRSTRSTRPGTSSPR